MLQKQLKDETEVLIQNQVTPWVFMKNHPGLRVKTFDEKEINYGGIEFSGSAEIKFWHRYIEPFLEEISFRVIDQVVERCKKDQIDLPPVLKDVQELLFIGFEKVYAAMADVDQRLRGGGYPERVPIKNTDNYLRSMEDFVERRIVSELTLWKPKPPIERFYERNKGLVYLVFSALGIVLAFLALW